MSYTNFTVETDSDGIVLVTWNMAEQSMNVFTEEAMLELNRSSSRSPPTPRSRARSSPRQGQFLGGADLTMLQKMLATFATEKAKDQDKAMKALFDNAGCMTWLFRKLETIGQALGLRDQRHLHGRRVRAVARLPWPRRGRLATR